MMPKRKQKSKPRPTPTTPPKNEKKQGKAMDTSSTTSRRGSMKKHDNPDTREQLSRPGIMDRQRQWSSEPEHGPGSDDLNTNDHHTHDPDSAAGRLDTEDRKFGGENDGSTDEDFPDENVSDDEGNHEEAGQMAKSSNDNSSELCLGVSKKELKVTPECLRKDLKLERGDNHTICIKYPYSLKEGLPVAFPSEAADKWDVDHVRMPYSSRSTAPWPGSGHNAKRWEIIKVALRPETPIIGPFELEEAILKYNSRYANKWNFTILHYYLAECMDQGERDQFFSCILPEMIELALSLPEICPMPIPLLKKGTKSQKLTLSQQQIACLLANAFFCTFPLRGARTPKAEYRSFPDINFCYLFQGQINTKKLEKLKCLIHYFKRVCAQMPPGIVTFHRQTLPTGRNWRTSTERLRRLRVSSLGTIEDDGIGMLQVDFANKMLGGGVLGHGCVQEEIRFIVCPELIITRLFTQGLDDLDSLIITGCERFSQYKGYADSFQWDGDYIDATPRDMVGRLCCEVVAIDAMVFKADYNRQFKPENVTRELNKAYCGFKTNALEANTPAVCTGNWGCGAFGGDKELKALIQLMAASEAKRDVCYFTFQDTKLVQDLYDVHSLLCQHNKTVGETMRLIEDYNRNGHRHQTLFQFIQHTLGRRRVPHSHSFPEGSSVDSPNAKWNAKW